MNVDLVNINNNAKSWTNFRNEEKSQSFQGQIHNKNIRIFVPTNEQLSSPVLYDKINSATFIHSDKRYNEEVLRRSLKNSEDSLKILKNMSNIKGSDPHSS